MGLIDERERNYCGSHRYTILFRHTTDTKESASRTQLISDAIWTRNHRNVSEVYYRSCCMIVHYKSSSTCKWYVLLIMLYDWPVRHHPNVSDVCYWSCCMTGLCQTPSKCKWYVLLIMLYDWPVRHHPNVSDVCYWSCCMTGLCQASSKISDVCYWSCCMTGLYQTSSKSKWCVLLIMLYEWPLSDTIQM